MQVHGLLRFLHFRSTLVKAVSRAPGRRFLEPPHRYFVYRVMLVLGPQQLDSPVLSFVLTVPLEHGLLRKGLPPTLRVLIAVSALGLLSMVSPQ